MEEENSDVKTAIISTVIILNIAANAIVIAVVARYSELREDPTTLFMLSLCASDIGFGFIVMPIGASVCSSATPNVQYLTVLPNIMMFFLWWFAFNSLHSLCWLTVCKMISVLKPFRYEQLFTSRRCYGVIVFNWVVGGALAASKFTLVAHFNIETCIHQYERSDSGDVLALISYGYGIVAPIVALFYATTRIFVVVVRAHTSMLAQVHSIEGSAGSGGLVTLQAVRSARNILIICFASFSLTVPVVLQSSLTHTGYWTPPIFRFAAVWLFACNTFTNSVLYVVLHSLLRKKTRLMFVGWYRYFSGG